MVRALAWAIGVEDKDKAGIPDPNYLGHPPTWMRMANFTRPPHDKKTISASSDARSSRAGL